MMPHLCIDGGHVNLLARRIRRRERATDIWCCGGASALYPLSDFPEPHRSRAIGLMVKQGLSSNRLTNIRVPFVVAAVSSLQPGGRLGLVLPAELLQVSYAAQLRSFLTDHFDRIDIPTWNDLFVDNAEQEVVLPLADGALPAASEIKTRQRLSVRAANFEIGSRDLLHAGASDLVGCGASFDTCERRHRRRHGRERVVRPLSRRPCWTRTSDQRIKRSDSQRGMRTNRNAMSATEHLTAAALRHAFPLTCLRRACQVRVLNQLRRNRIG